MKITIENLVLANGRLLIKKVDKAIYEVIKVAKNCGKSCNYEGLGRNIKEGDTVLISDYVYLSVTLDGVIYYIVKPSEIYGIFN